MSALDPSVPIDAYMKIILQHLETGELFMTERPEIDFAYQLSQANAQLAGKGQIRIVREGELFIVSGVLRFGANAPIMRSSKVDANAPEHEVTRTIELLVDELESYIE